MREPPGIMRPRGRKQHQRFLGAIDRTESKEDIGLEVRGKGLEYLLHHTNIYFLKGPSRNFKEIEQFVKKLVKEILQR